MQFSLSSMRRRFAAPTPALVVKSAAHGWVSREEAIMGTAIRVELWCDESDEGDAAATAVMAEMHRIDALLSPYKEDSELSLINRDAARRAVPVSAETMRLLVRAAQFSELSGGAFDITYASLGHLFDYRLGIRPSEAAASQARAAIGWRHLILDTHAGTVRFAREGVRIDLGGFAKGHAVDNCVAILQQHGIVNAIVAAGGDSRVLGDRRGRPWTIAIRDPRHSDGVVAVLPLEDVSISTSGDYERYFEEDGVRFHHLIDPHTGASPSGVRSVTVLAPDGLTSEALSKTVFVLGSKRGFELVESLPGVDAIVVDAAGVLRFSPGLLHGASARLQ
ncbi:MAG: FAD:protein FMN transferase [Burkholderiaceae bacterium]